MLRALSRALTWTPFALLLLAFLLAGIAAGQAPAPQSDSQQKPSSEVGPSPKQHSDDDYAKEDQTKSDDKQTKPGTAQNQNSSNPENKITPQQAEQLFHEV